MGQQNCNHNPESDSNYNGLDVIEIADKYSFYRTKEDIEENDLEAITAIIEQSFSEPELYDWINQVDELIESQLEYGQMPNYQRIKGVLVVRKLIKDLIPHPFDTLTLSEFEVIVREFARHLDRDFIINSYITFNQDSFIRNLIAKSKQLTVYAIGWLPKQDTDTHHHGNDLDAILVLDGQLTHWQWDARIEPKNAIEPTPQYFGKGQILIIDRHQCHKIANTASNKLYTLHIRLGDLSGDIFQDDRWNQDWSRDFSPAWSRKSNDFNESSVVMLGNK
jgi:predicted metal-dependent enzyme (double-stranded beta helix superfamily)